MESRIRIPTGAPNDRVGGFPWPCPEAALRTQPVLAGQAPYLRAWAAPGDGPDCGSEVLFREASGVV